jgi:hypothetical protein
MDRRHVNRAVSNPDFRRRVLIDVPRLNRDQPPVNDVCVLPRTEQDVLRFEIPMPETLVVDIRDSVRRIAERLQLLPQGEPAQTSSPSSRSCHRTSVALFACVVSVVDRNDAQVGHSRC